MDRKTNKDFGQIAQEIYRVHAGQSPSIYAFRPTEPVASTCTYVTLHNYSWFTRLDREESTHHNWLYKWKKQRNDYLERFGSVSKEIELFILERSLREYFEETNAGT